MGFDLEKLFLYGGLAATAGVVAYAYRSLRAVPSLRGLFIMAVIGVTSYLNLHLVLEAEDLLTPFGVFDTWFRHLVFYAGQLLFFILINRIIFYGGDSGKKRRNRRETPGAAALLLLAALLLPLGARAHHGVNLLVGDPGAYQLALYVTEQGAEHAFAIVFFILALAILQSQGVYAESSPGFEARRRIITPLLLGNAVFTLLHIWEFLAESRHLFDALSHDAMEIIEYGFFFVGLLLLLIGAHRLAKESIRLTAGAPAT